MGSLQSPLLFFPFAVVCATILLMNSQGKKVLQLKHHRILLCLCLTFFLSCCLLPVSTAANEIRPSVQEDMMGDIIGGPCGSNLTWRFNGDTLTISGEGEMMFNGTTNYKAPWDSFRADIRCLVIEPGVTTIRYGAFKDCTALDTVYLSDKLFQIS